MAKIMALIAAIMLPSITVAECANQVELLAKNIYYEARGEGRRGMRLVADTTLNRVRSEKFPNTICGVINQKGQFQWVGKINNKPKGKSWELALDIAKKAIEEGPRQTNVLYFKAVGGESWQNRNLKIKYKNHSFY